MGYLNDYFQVSDSKAPVVELDQALHDDRIIEAFVPVKSTLDVFGFLKDATSLHASSSRAVLCHGAYGSGKSYMVAVLCRLFREGFDHSSLQPIWDRMRTRDWDDPLKDLEKVLGGGDEFKPWLVVPLYAAGQGATLENALLKSLITHLRKEHLEPQDIIGPTWYEAAANLFKDLLAKGAKYEPAKSGEFATNEDLIKALIEDSDQTAFAELEEWFKRAYGGLSLHNNLQSDGLCNVGEAYAKAAANIQTHGYKGILVLWDEFGFALEQLLKGHNSGERNLGTEVMALQQFLEKSCGKNVVSGGQVAFMGFTHFSMAEYGDRAQLQTIDSDIFKKVTDRFRQPDIRIRLEIAEAEGYHLLSGMISQTDQGRALVANNFPNWNALAKAMPGYELWSGMEPANILRDIVKPSYPMHPATASILLRLSDKVAQMNRTAFYYMADKTNGLHAQLGEREMPSREKIGSSELIRPHSLFAFFEDALKAYDRTLYKNYVDAVRKLPSDDEMAVDLLRYVLILSVANIKVSTDMLCFCLADTEKSAIASEVVIASLERCVKAKALSKNGYTDIWSYGVAGIDIEQIIAEEEQNIQVRHPARFIYENQRIKEELAEYLGVFDLAPAKSGIIRRIRVEIPDIRCWDFDKVPQVNPAVESPGQSWCSAVLYLIIPDSDQMARGWRERIAQCKPSESYFMIPDRTVDIQSDIKRFAAVMRILDGGNLDAERQAAFEDEFAHLGSALREEFNRYFGSQGFSSGTEIFKAGQADPVFTVTNWYDLFAKTAVSVETQCDKEILVRCPSFNEWQDSKKAGIKKIIESVLSFDETPSCHTQYLGFNETSLEAAVVDGVLATNGMLKKGLQQEWSLTDYSDKEVQLPAVIERIRSYMLSGGSKKNLLKLFAELIEPPFGIPNGLIPVLIALAIRNDLERLTFFSAGGNPIAKSKLDEELAKIIVQSVKCSFRYEKLTGTSRHVYRALAHALGKPLLIRELTGVTFTERCKDILKEVRSWAQAFPDMVVDLGVLTTEEKKFIARLRNPVPPDSKDLSDMAIAMFSPYADVASELANATTNQLEYPEVVSFWGDLNLRIKNEVAESRSVVEEHLRKIPKDVMSFFRPADDEKDTNVDEFVAKVCNKPSKNLGKEDFRYVQGKLDILKEMQAEDATVSLVLPNAVEKIECYSHAEVEAELGALFDSLKEKYSLAEKDLFAICLKLLYGTRAYKNYSVKSESIELSTQVEVD
jgi:hypothetical protein